MFGNERQVEFGAKLDAILEELTKGTNPVLFQLFDQLSKGVEGVNLAELEKEIQESMKTSFFGRMLESMGLSSAAKRLQKANERVGGMLKSKSTSLLDICNNMQETTRKEVVKLINDSKRLEVLAKELKDNVDVFGDYVAAGRTILENAKQKHAALLSNGDAAEAKQLEDKIQLFENRVTILETVLVKAPTNIEAIRLGMNAGLQTLGETANSAVEDFNDIKGELIKLSVTHQIQTVQTLNEERRKLKASLTSHANQQLANVAVNAVKTQGLNRLQDAENLLKSAQELKEINTKVKAECAENVNRIAQARMKLSEIKQLTEK